MTTWRMVEAPEEEESSPSLSIVDTILDGSRVCGHGERRHGRVRRARGS